MSCNTIYTFQACTSTGRSFSEALVLAHVYKYCFECQNKKKQFLYTTCSELVLFGEFNKQSLMKASEKYFPVTPQLGPNFNGDRLHLASLLSLGETTRIMTIVYNIWQPIETFPISLLKIAKTQ